MRQQSLAESEKSVPFEEEQKGLSNLKKQLRYGKQSTENSVIIMRWLTIFFCLAFWYGVYRLVKLFIF